MLFNSWQYAIFLPVVLALYYLIPKGKKWIVLLAASFYFYMCWNPALILLMLFSTVVHFFAARAIARMRENGASKKRQKPLLVLSVSVSLLMLVLFKYFDFFSRSAAAVAALAGVRYDPLILNLTLPMGISFYTFQTLSYTIDVYRGDVPAEKNLGYFALFVMYFPQLVAGPIERVDRLLPQLKEEHAFSYDNFVEGLLTVTLGLFKKIVVADTFAKGVDVVYNGVTDFTGLPLILATLLFAFQIYCDFSGYSDIAMGSARMMGIELMQNFRAPYLSQSIREFWSRWHISLSTWFRDYVYIPLGGSRCSRARGAINVLITFLLSGLWHGANWTFVVWGGIHGACQIVEKCFFGDLRKKNGGALTFSALPRILLTFIIVCAAWVFFRANTLSDAFYVFGNMFRGIARPAQYLRDALGAMQISKIGAVLLMAEAAGVVCLDLFAYRGNPIRALRAKKWYVRWPIYVLLAFTVVLLSTKSTVSAFIYFQF